MYYRDLIRKKYLLTFIFCFFLPLFSFAQSPIEKANFLRVSLHINSLITRSEANILILEERSLLSSYGAFGTSLLFHYNFVDSEEKPDEAGTFIFAVPLSRDFAVDTALELSERLLYSNAKLNIIVAFLSDEYLSLSSDINALSHKGLRDLLSLSEQPENWVLCYFDADIAPNNLLIHHGVRAYMTPRGIIEPFTSLISSKNIPWSFRIWYNEFLYLGILQGPELMDVAWQEGINNFVLSGATGDSISNEESIISSLSIAELILEYASLISFPILVTDMHYSLLPLPGGNFVYSSEGVITAFSIGILGILLLIFLCYTAKNNVLLVINSINFIRHIWLFLLLVILLILSIRVSGIIYSFIFTHYEGQELYINYIGLMLTIILAVLLYFLPSPLLSLTHFRRRSQFYGFSAVVVIVIGIFYTVLVDYSNILIFIWALLFIFIGAIVTKPIVIIICTSMVPMFAIIVLLNMSLSGSAELTEFFITSNWIELLNWQLSFEVAILTLPLFLLSKRAFILYQKGKRKGLEPIPKRKYRLVLIPVLIMVVLFAMYIQLQFIQDSRIPAEIRYQHDNNIVQVHIDDTIFQDTRIISITVISLYKPIRYDINLHAEDNVILPIYTSQIPYFRESQGQIVSFLLGEYPPEIFTFDFAVPVNFNARLSVQALFNNWIPELDPETEPITSDYLLIVHANDNFITAN